jgi:hypothetical protein
MNGRSRVSAFEMNRFLSSHLSKKEDLVSEKNDSNNDDDSDEDDDSEKNNGDDGNEQADNVKEALVPDEALLNNSDYREREHGSVDSEHELKLQQQL